jgi:transcriptional regulator with XRE-family HTH domain
MRKNKDPKLMAIDAKVGVRWKAARKAAGLTLRQVAAKMAESGYPIHPSSIQRLECGKSMPDHFQTLLMLLCALYNTNPNAMFGAQAPSLPTPTPTPGATNG